MITRCVIRLGEYFDSVTLMQTARDLTTRPGVVDAALVMGTQANKGILRQAGMFLPEVGQASANDLVLVVQAESEEAATEGLEAAVGLLTQGTAPKAEEGGFRPRTIRGAMRTRPEAQLAVISVAGEHAAGEAWEALRNGLHVLLFSNNVAVEDEVALKRYAKEHDLLLMGPDCGTAIINRVALGFANVVSWGPVGIVAAAGTGLQEVSVLLARRGVGISQGIGTGGRDLKEAVGGITMLQGISALQADPGTSVLLLVSKAPAPVVARQVLEHAVRSEKPTVVCFLGGDPRPVAEAGAIPARTLQEAAYLAAEEVEGHVGASADELIRREVVDLRARAAELKQRLDPGQRYLRALYSGGTLASEALVIWKDVVKPVRSNVSPDPDLRLEDPRHSAGHTAVDLGEDVFTVGRPHPMIDQELRIHRLIQEAGDPRVAVILLDVVLGYGAHPDPARELGPAIRRARQYASGEGRELLVITSVTGTDEDPQSLTRQVSSLEEAGAIVASCNASAARLAGFVVA